MNGLREKFRNKKGFTLVEMLIVVAIIAILIAVSIPMVGSALESSRHAVDDANERDAISLATVAYLTGKVDKNDGTMEEVEYTGGKATLYYVVGTADSGKHQAQLLKSGPGVKAECQCKEGHENCTLSVEIDQATGKVTAKWEGSTP